MMGINSNNPTASNPNEGNTIDNGSESEGATGLSAFTRDAEGNVVFTIALKHNEKVTLLDLPAGTEYIVNETEANKNGYITTINGMITFDGSSKGIISADETTEAEYQNTYDVILKDGTKTGDTILPITALTGLALLSAIIALVARRNMRKN